MRWILDHETAHKIVLARTSKELVGGNILFLISCSEIIDSSDRAKYDVSLVLHASELPRGRGWSPHIWQLIDGAEFITLSLVEVEDVVDSGRIWYQKTFFVPKHALWNEINDKLFSAEIEFIDIAISQFYSVTPSPQRRDIKPSYFPKRNQADSKINPEESITSQFDKIRVCDPQRYPAYFEWLGHKYKLTLEKISEI
jgi:methionyl-tRNA formyltransferase